MNNKHEESSRRVPKRVPNHVLKQGLPETHKIHRTIYVASHPRGDMRRDGKDAKLILEDGSVFYGKSFGSKRSTAGEIVFNTGMSGYPESMTDPSYAGEILCMTYPLVGNYGVPGGHKDIHGIEKNFESGKIHVRGIIVSEFSEKYSHWSAVMSLDDWMKENNIPGICDIDTRELAKKIRDSGSMLGKIVYGKNIPFFDPEKENLAAAVSVDKPIVYKPADKLHGSGKKGKKVILVDCGCKNSIIRNLLERGVGVVRVPWNYNFHNGKFDYDGVVISNGPGNPKWCKETISNIRKEILKQKPKPIFGVCLGNQVMALAAGADTYKLKFGHRGENQPCIETGAGRCYITSQNHGYAVDVGSLKRGWKEWFRNANDGTNEGIIHDTKPFMSVQFHPEAKSGPIDTNFLFDRFAGLL